MINDKVCVYKIPIQAVYFIDIVDTRRYYRLLLNIQEQSQRCPASDDTDRADTEPTEA